MTTELERRLREALHEDAQGARLVNPDGPPALEARDLTVTRRRPSARRLVAVAATIVLIVAAGVAVVQNREQEPDVSTVDPLAEAFEGLSVGDTEVFTDVPPGSTVALPPEPISERSIPTVVWTGTEMIVWAGMDADQVTLDDGAAFDLASGTWRVIAPAPIEARLFAQVAWTGTEMLVWGGQRQYSVSGPDVETNGLADGAAYNPTTDTWRVLPGAPIDAGGGVASVWTGDELVVVAEVLTEGAFDTTEVVKRTVAYNPETDEWRQLADAPTNFDFDLLWTGETILTTTGTAAMRYDLGDDSWQRLDDVPSDDVAMIPVTDADGGSRAVLVLAHEAGAPIVVLDPAGNTIGTLPGIPDEGAKFGDLHTSGGVWTGEEALFYIQPRESQEPLEHWALNPATRTWRQLDADEAPPTFDPNVLELVPDAGVLIGWAALSPNEDGPSSGVVYRPPTVSDG